MGITEQEAAAITFNKEFCRRNHIPYDRRQNQIPWMAYLKVLVRDQRARGGDSYVLPGEPLRPGKLPGPGVPTPVTPLPVPPVRPPIHSDSLENILQGAQNIVDRLTAFIRSQK